MKILVVSHNVFSKTSNMGKTLASYFKDLESCELAQFYIHSEVPTDSICENYYRITDKEAIKSIFTRKSGTVLGKDDIRNDVVTSRTDTGTTAKLYQRARKRTPMTYIARNMWWRLGAWKTKKMRAWLDEFNPDVVFFASGDYGFMYKIALEIAKYKNIPLLPCCMDDYFLYNKNSSSIFGRWAHKRFMKQVKRTMEYASCIFTICDKMNRDYSALFNKPCKTLHTSATITEPLEREAGNAISYIGNLSYMRYKQLISLGHALKDVHCDGKPEFIDVYSAEKRDFILNEMTEENGIRFHGSIDQTEVLNVMKRSLAVIHTESFNEDARKSVAYSVSTKIADSLASGVCLIAYGPSEVASIAYLIENEAALCITENDDVKEKLTSLISDGAMRDGIVANALSLAKKNHCAANNCNVIQSVLDGICKNK